MQQVLKLRWINITGPYSYLLMFSQRRGCSGGRGLDVGGVGLVLLGPEPDKDPGQQL